MEWKGIVDGDAQQGEKSGVKGKKRKRERERHDHFTSSIDWTRSGSLSRRVIVCVIEKVRTCKNRGIDLMSCPFAQNASRLSSSFTALFSLWSFFNSLNLHFANARSTHSFQETMMASSSLLVYSLPPICSVIQHGTNVTCNQLDNKKKTMHHVGLACGAGTVALEIVSFCLFCHKAYDITDPLSITKTTAYKSIIFSLSFSSM